MKCIPQFFTAFLLFVTTGSFAQNTFPSSGNVGIGISSPYWPLEVNGVIKSSKFFLGNDIGFHPIAGGQSVIQSWWGLQLSGLTQEYPSSYNSANIGSSSSAHVIIPMVNTSAVGLHIKGVGFQGGDYFNVSSSGGTADVLALGSSGYLGLGTTSPESPLHIKRTQNNISAAMKFTSSYTGVADSYVGNYGNYGTIIGHNVNPENGSFSNSALSPGQNTAVCAIVGGTATGNMFSISNYPSGVMVKRFVLDVNGNVGIGTSTPQSKLSVNGTITTTKLKVTQTGWADYVFENDYSLPTLKEVEAFIKAHKHLPGVVSAKEVETDGLDVAENQAVLLKKIEEMTLYMIEMKKQIDDQQKKISQLEKQAVNK